MNKSELTNCQILRRGATVSIEIACNDPQPVFLLSLYNQLITQQKVDWKKVCDTAGYAVENIPFTQSEASVTLKLK